MLHTILAFPLLLFLPGFTLVNLLFPRKGELDQDYDALYRITLGVVMSIVVVVLYGIFLNTLGVNQATGLGYFTASSIWIGVSVLTTVFFLGGWLRGAYPVMGRLHPALKRDPPPEPASLLRELNVDKEVLARFRELAAERERLRRTVKDQERRAELHTGSAREHYERKLKESRKKLREVDASLQRLEERAGDLY